MSSGNCNKTKTKMAWYRLVRITWCALSEETEWFIFIFCLEPVETAACCGTPSLLLDDVTYLNVWYLYDRAFMSLADIFRASCVPSCLVELVSRLLEMRRSTIEVHPKLSEAPHLTLLGPQSRFWGQIGQISSSLSPKRDCGPKRVKELYTQPENWLRQRSNCIPTSNPMAQVYENVIFRSKIIGIPTSLGRGIPLLRKTNIGNVLPLS